ncbi:MAG: hypothetical protein NZT92_09650 [Abditibacteriales bacterium]|nr:hypothetical protein [Abditibacteriales bacterium]MDW8367131.1 hypothetical protein [Abditibacteriales bacterium]
MAQGSQYQSFGQEFYPYEAMKAIRLAQRIHDRRALRDHIAQLLPHPSAQTRRRVANKLIQRYVPCAKGAVLPSPFLALMNHIRDYPTQIELLYYELTKTDRIVGAMARHIFYPYFIEDRIPGGFEEQVFRVLNASQLFVHQKIITRDFVEAFARQMWNFRNVSTLRRALRILSQAGIIRNERLLELRYHPVAYGMNPHDIGLTTFVYCLYDEFLNVLGKSAPTVAEVQRARFVRTFLLTPQQVNHLLQTARRYRFIHCPAPPATNAHTHAVVRLPFPTLADGVRELTAKAV